MAKVSICSSSLFILVRLLQEILYMTYVCMSQLATVIAIIFAVGDDTRLLGREVHLKRNDVGMGLLV